MPIYSYKCSTCQHELDVLQRIADAPLTHCPKCGAATFSKQLTAAGFQLKGSGWYATDFKNGAATDAKPAAKPADDKAGESPSAPAKPAPAAASTPGSAGASSAGS